MTVADETIPGVARYDCNNCPMFEAVHGTTPSGDTLPVGGGICRANPPVADDMGRYPQVTTFGQPRVGVWPMVNGNDWCGRHPARVASYSDGIAIYRAKFQADALDRIATP